MEPQAKFTVGKSKAVEDKTVVVEEIAFFDEHEKQLFTDRGLLDQQEDLNQIKILQEEQKEKAKIFAKFPVKKIKKKSIKIVSPQPVKNSTTSFKYHVIAGCFGVESNAGKMVLRLQKAGFPNAQLAGSSNSGLHRVSYGSYNNKVVALKALAKAKLSHNSKAWLAND
ncbi:MAG: cell division protein FtsN [Flavobacteriales bacterium]